MKQLNFDVIVIGCGPAGMTAAIYLKRANLNVAIIDGNAPGGQVNRIISIENYPGFIKIAGADLAYNMFMQTQELKIPYKYGVVNDIVVEDGYKIVKTDKEELTCKGVILATGRKPRELGLPNEKNLIGRGISWCAICDGALFKDKNVVVIGGGNSALEESLYLSNIAAKVSMIHRSSEFRGDMILQERIFNNNKIEVFFNSEVVGLNAENNMLSSVDIKNKQDGSIKQIAASGMFIYIGFEPSLEYAKDLGITTDNNYIIVDDMMRTNVDGIYACGDIVKKELYQITTAVAEGSMAATSAIKDIKEEK